MNDFPYEIIGNYSGPTSIILVGIHGNERCGIEAAGKILPTLQIDNGRILFMHGNPKAIEQNIRFIDVNLNRMFKPDDQLTEKEKASYEYARAQILKKYMDEATALLDIHASNTPDSRPFIICDKKLNPIAKYLPFDLVVNGFDEIQPGGTESYMKEKGDFGICIECGYAADSSSTLIAEQAIISFLIEQGHLVGDKKQYEQSIISVHQLYKTKTNQFTLVKMFDDFEKLTQGQLIGHDGDEEVRASTDGFIIFARNRTNSGDEGFVFGK